MKDRILRRILFGMCIILCLTVLTGCGSSRVTKETDAVTLGIDVARYQGTIDWQQVRHEGIDFAMIRVGYRTLSDGVIEPDSNGRYNLQECGKAEIPMGVYFFSTAITEEEAEEEAQWTADFISQYPITYPVVYDCERFREEGSRQFHLTNKERTDIALAFLRKIEELGYEGMFYGSKNELEAFWEVDRIDPEYKIWVAQYPAEPYPETPESSYMGVHQMWQYTQEGTMAGIETGVDINVSYFGYDGIEPAKNPEPPAEAFPDPEVLMNFTDVNEMVTAKVETNLRSIPSQDTDSEVLRTLYNGEIAQRIAVSDSGWSKVVYQDETFYALTSYLTTDLNFDPEDASGVPEASPESAEPGQEMKTQFQDTDQLMTAKERVNLRELPGTGYDLVHPLVHGEVAVCTGISDNGWARMEYQGKTCYGVYSYMEPIVGAEGDVGMSFEEVSETVTTTKAVNIRTLPSTDKRSTVILKAAEGETFQRIGVNQDLGWSKILYHGVTLYCSSAYLTTGS